MFRAFKAILHHADDQARCRRRRFSPSVPESASCLEDRALLSAAGGMAHAAEVSTNMAHTAAGKEVTNLFESILQTNPTGAQLTQWVHKLHSGMSVKTLRKDLTAEVQGELGGWAPASLNAVSIDGDLPASALARSAAETVMPPGLSAPTNTIVSPVDLSQVPAGMRFSRSFTSSPSPTSTSGGTVVTSTPTTSSPTATPTPTPTATPTPMPTATPTPMPMSPTPTMPWMP